MKRKKLILLISSISIGIVGIAVGFYSCSQLQLAITDEFCTSTYLMESYQVERSKRYCEKRAEEVERYKETHGHYPSDLPNGRASDFVFAPLATFRFHQNTKGKICGYNEEFGTMTIYSALSVCGTYTYDLKLKKWSQSTRACS